nr:hypothetical protein Itr_chr09CG16610 [Ipomoea trifida]
MAWLRTLAEPTQLVNFCQSYVANLVTSTGGVPREASRGLRTEREIPEEGCVPTQATENLGNHTCKSATLRLLSC